MMNKRIVPIQIRLTKDEKKAVKKIVEDSDYDNIYEYVKSLIQTEKIENNLINKNYTIKDDKLSFRPPTEDDKKALLDFAKDKGYTFAELLTALIEMDIIKKDLEKLNSDVEFHRVNLQNSFMSLKASIGKEEASKIIENIILENNFNLILDKDRIIIKNKLYKH